MRLVHVRGQAMLCERSLDARNQIAPIRFVIDVLELATAALGKVTAWRHLVMRAGQDCPVTEHLVAGYSERNVPAARSDAVAARGNSNDFVSHSTSRALAEWPR